MSVSYKTLFTKIHFLFPKNPKSPPPLPPLDPFPPSSFPAIWSPFEAISLEAPFLKVSKNVDNILKALDGSMLYFFAEKLF